MSTEITYFTKEGLDRLKEELRELRTKGRSEMSRAISDARDKGDLSENAEYDAAKDAQGHMEAKINSLETILAGARIIDESVVDISKVMIMSTVRVRNHNSGKEITYTLVSEKEANLKEGRISVKSPMGQGLLGRKIGDKSEILAPAGKILLEVLEISRG